jgi:rhamnulose-1-phosphate aldolase/alcohol dehydrogenase
VTATATPIPGTTELERLVARSRLIGSDRSLVLHGGGNTSTKLVETDHLGRERRVIRIKGSGSDLATCGPRDFPGLWLDEVLPIRGREQLTDEEMLEYLAHCLVDPGSPRPSVETLLHAFLPAPHVDHVHADAICALANAPDPEAAVRDALGDDVAVVEYIRPGFQLSCRVAELADRRAVVLAHHGLVTWGDAHKESYGLLRELVSRARDYLKARGADVTVPFPVPVPVPAAPSPPALQPPSNNLLLARLRGRVSRERRQVLAVDQGQRDLADRADAAELAAQRGTPDHMLRIGVRSCVLDGDLDERVGEFERWYAAFFARHADGGTTMLLPQPRAFLVPGVGCVAAGPDAPTARQRLELAAHSHRTVAATRDAFGGSSWLSERELFDFDYWPLELYKLTRLPPPPELAGFVVVVTGAASGIGKAVALDLAGRGAHLVLADRDGARLKETFDLIPGEQKVAYTGDLTETAFVDEVVEGTLIAYGGVDGAVLNAGVAATGMLGEVDDAEWRRSLEINLTAHFELTRRLWPVLREQGIGGSLVFVGSKNAFAPGAGFGPYSVAKAGIVQLARIAAIEGGPLGIRSNVVNPDAIFGDSRLFSDEVRAQRAAAHGVPPEELEAFYARRSLLGREVKAADVAEAVAFLLSDRSRATTGCVVTVDGGVAAAFPR